MYCDNCHKQSPDNFVNCPYCSAPLSNGKKTPPRKFVKSKERKKPISFKAFVCGAVGIALALTVAAVTIGVLTGSKPDSAVNKMVKAIETRDSELYYSLYDDFIKEYNKENWYYGDEETFNAMTQPLSKSVDFYSSNCGEDFSLSCEISNTTYLSDEALEEYTSVLSASYGYTKLPKKVAVLDFSVVAKGEKGSYTSVYNSAYFIQLGGVWYKASNILELEEIQSAE